MQNLSACPVCQKKNFAKYLSCKDHTVSHETFTLEQCKDCGLVLTNPRPDIQDMPRYYQSDAYISHSDKPLNLIDQVYKISRHFTLQWKYNVTQQYSLRRPASILDFGCGTGAFLRECQKHNMKIAGIEPSPIAREQAQQNTGIPMGTDTSHIQGEFDAITLWHVLEHVADFNETLRTLKGHLSEKGTIFIAVPNLLSHDAKKYQANWAGYDVPRHFWHFSRSTMAQIVKQHNLNLVTTIPMRLDAYYVSLLSEKYNSGTTTILNMARAVQSGWISNRAARKTSDYSSLIYILRK